MEDSLNLEQPDQQNAEAPKEGHLDKVALRREARRRKILENAKNRLERLGVSQNEIKTMDNEQYSDPEVEMEIPAHLLAKQAQISQMSQPPPLQFENLFSGGLFASPGAPGAGGPATQQANPRSIYFRLRLHLFLVAAVTMLLAVWGGDTFRQFGIFIPPGLLIIIELVFFRPPKPLNPLINLLLTMCGLQPQKASQLLNLFGIVQSLICDLGILVFFYCVSAWLLTYTGDKQSNLIVVH